MLNPATSGVELPDDALLKKFDVPAPRYTSYPTADRFHKDYGVADYEAALKSRNANPNKNGLSLYCHIPFCNDVCF